jgi:hypothetical protein
MQQSLQEAGHDWQEVIPFFMFSLTSQITDLCLVFPDFRKGIWNLG